MGISLQKNYPNQDYPIWDKSCIFAGKLLIQKDFITQEKSAYMVYDPFFGLWLQGV